MKRFSKSASKNITRESDHRPFHQARATEHLPLKGAAPTRTVLYCTASLSDPQPILYSTLYDQLSTSTRERFDMASGEHPYYPRGAHLSGGVFTSNTWDVATLILTFAAGLTLLLAITWAIVKKTDPTLKQSDQLLALWFVMSK